MGWTLVKTTLVVVGVLAAGQASAQVPSPEWPDAPTPDDPQQQQPPQQGEPPPPDQLPEYPQAPLDQAAPEQPQAQPEQPPPDYAWPAQPDQYPGSPPSPPPPEVPPPGRQPAPPPPPPSTPTPTAPPVVHSGLMLIAFLGVSGFGGASGINDYIASDLAIHASLRLGGLIGFYVHPHLSLNGELTTDFLNIDAGSSASITAGTRVVAALSPLFHWSASNDVELLVGPKLGYWHTSLSGSSDNISTITGTVVGVNAGGYLRAYNVHFGALVSYELASIGKACSGYPGAPDTCLADVSYLSREKVLSLSGSILF
jgi:hypothetical protein